MSIRIKSIIAGLGLLGGVFAASAQGTAFTYQGQLNYGGNPVSGAFDLTFTLYAAPTGGSAVVPSLTNLAVVADSGQFSTILDFGTAVFTGPTYWIEIGARTNGASTFSTLAPRLQVFPTPYAIYASSAGVAANAVNATTADSFSGLLTGDVIGTQGTTVVAAVGGQSAAVIASGILAVKAATSADAANTIVRRDGAGGFAAGIVAASEFIGDGSGLTNIPASSLTGTVASTLLTNVAFLSASNNLTNVVIATNNANQFAGSFYGNLTGNAATATSASVFMGSLLGDVTGSEWATVVNNVGGQTAAAVASGTAAANGATSGNVANTIVQRDAVGNFFAGTVTAENFNGNGAGLSNIPASSLTGTLANSLLTNVAFVTASNNLTNVLIATNEGNQFAGSFTGNLAGNASSSTIATSATTASGFTGPLAGDVTGTQAATIVVAVGGQTASSIASGVVAANDATSTGAPNTIVERDATGGFSAGTVSAANFTGNGVGLTNIPASSLTGTVANSLLTNVAFLTSSNNLSNILIATNSGNQLTGSFTGTLNGNATSATTSTSAANASSFSGPLVGDVTGTQGATVVSIVGGQTASAVASGVVAANSATTGNSANTIVERDATGSFSAGTVSATSFSGNGVGLTNVPASSLTGIVPNILLTNVAFLSASNNLTNVLIATNPANQISGTFIGNLAGNATSATSSASAGSAATFTGSLIGDVTGPQTGTVVSTVAGQTASAVASGVIAANSATPANVANAIVERDSTGSFLAGTVAATNFTGNGAGLTNVPGSSLTGSVANALLTNVAFLSTSNNLIGVLVATNSANQFGGSFTGNVAGNATSATTATSATSAGSFSGSLTGDVAGTQGATVVSTVGGQTATAVAIGVVAANAATSANIANTIVERDSTGSFLAGTVGATNFSGNAAGLTNVPASSLTGTVANALLTNVAFLSASNNLTNVLVATNSANQFSGSFTGDLAGNATSATSATSAASATSFTGSLTGDVTGTQGATVVSTVGGQTATAVASGAIAANAATSANIANTIVERDSAGNFLAGSVSATNFNGNGTGLSNIPSSSLVGPIANALLTNVAFLTASNNLTNVVVATNEANQFAGSFSGSFSGNATSATTAITADSFSGSLIGDVIGTQEATVVSTIGGQTASAVASGAVAANNATTANDANTIVERDGSGGFLAGTVIATNFTGNGIGLTNIPASSLTGTLANTLLTNVAFLSASNILTNVLIATNLGNQFGGSFTGNVAGNATSATSATSANSATSFTGSLIGDVTGTQEATVVSTVGGQTAAAIASGIVAANAATSANIANTIVERDSTGGFLAGTVTATNFRGNGVGLTNLPAASLIGTVANSLLTNVAFLTASNNLSNILIATNLANRFKGSFTGNLAGNATSATSATSADSATSFTGSLNGDVTGTQGTTVVSTVGGETALAVATGAVAANAATSANVANTIVERDSTGSFLAGTVGATNFSGNAAGLTNVPASSLTGTVANALLTNVAFLSASNNLTNVLVATNSANQFSGSFTGDLAGNATSATSATSAASATSFTGSLTGDVTGTQGATVVSTIDGQTATAVASGAVAANAANSANIANTIVERDSAGSFLAGTVSATNFSGNGSGLTNVPSSSLTGPVANVLLTNVAFLSASNNFTNVLIATNLGNHISGSFTGDLAGNATSATSATSAASATSFTGSLTGDVTGTQGATVVSTVGGQTATAVASGAIAANAATSANIANTIVERDSAGNFLAGSVSATNFNGNGTGLSNIPSSSLVGPIANALLTNVAFLTASNNLTNVVVATNEANQFAGSFSGSFSGNATSATTAITADSFSGSLIGDVIGTQEATVVSTIGGQTAAAVASGATAANAATSTNIANTIVERDSTGSFLAGTVGATNFSGNAAGLTNVPASSLTGTVANVLLTNVAFLSASNNLIGVLVATNSANQLSGSFTGDLAGNATSATSATLATSATSFTSPLIGDVIGTQGATVVSTIGGQTAAAVASGAIAANAATSANIANTIVERDSTGGFLAGTVSSTNFSGNGAGLTNLPASSLTGTIANGLLTNVAFLSASNTLTNVLIATNLANQLNGSFIGNLAGNAATATSATSASTATAFTGSLSGDVTGTQNATVVSTVGGQTASSVASGALAANGASSTNLADTLIKRDSTGSFLAGTVTATNFNGNGAGLTNLPASSLTGTVANNLLTNVAFLSASNNLTNVLIATNVGNHFSGSFTGNLAGTASSATSATSASFATSAGNFIGSLSGNVTGTQSGTVVASVGGKLASAVASAVTTVTSATSAATPSTLVLRDASGNFSGGTIFANNFSGDGSTLTNYQGTNVVDYAASNLFNLSGGTNVAIPFQQEGAIYQVVTTNLCFSNIMNLQPGYNKMTVYLQATNTFTVSWLPHVNLVGGFTTNGLQLTNSQGWYVMAVTVLGTNWQSSTCTYAICPPNL